MPEESHNNWIRFRGSGHTESQVRSRLQSTADYWGRADDFGTGKLNIYEAVAELSVSISGTGKVTRAGNYTWTASASGGNGTFSYTWYVDRHDGYGWTSLGTGSSKSLYVASGDNSFNLRVDVTSGGLSASTQKTVIVSIF